MSTHADRIHVEDAPKGPIDSRPSAPVIEIIKRRKGSAHDGGPYDVIVPNDVRINGQSLLCSDDPVIIHEISTAFSSVVRVTVTFLARRVVFDHEEI